MTNISKPSKGLVYLIGAGPGDPGLMTVRGAELLSRADVVLYDYLANPQVLQHAGPHAELICMGRHGVTRIWSQQEINDAMVQLADQGKTVVRLKGGDPAVFARSAEETAVLSQAGIDFEIVPGITAALAAGSYAGIPITHRDLASAVAFVTGQENPEKPESPLDFSALARFPGTLVFYMGVTRAPQWTSALIEAGKSADTPAAIIRRCSLPDQTTIRCRLGEVADHLSPGKKLRPPAVVVIGDVAALPESLSWFEHRPLFGTRVMITRPQHQCPPLHEKLAELGADVLVCPAIEISQPDDWGPVDAVIDRLAEFDWIVFSSANGVEYFFQRLLEQGRDLRSLASLRIAAIGPGTAARIAEFHLRADLQPTEFRAEALADALASDAAGKRFLLIRASRGREVLAEQLEAAGGTVEQIVVYSSRDSDHVDDAILQQLDAGAIDWITVTSSAIARSLAAMFGPRLNMARLASISPITSATLRDLGFQPAAEATEYTMDGVVQCLLQKTTADRKLDSKSEQKKS